MGFSFIGDRRIRGPRDRLVVFRRLTKFQTDVAAVLEQQDVLAPLHDLELDRAQPRFQEFERDRDVVDDSPWRPQVFPQGTEEVISVNGHDKGLRGVRLQRA